MELLIIILNKEEYLEKILSILIEAGVSGATISDSEGIGHFLAYEVPIFAGLRQFVGESKSVTRTILAVLDDRSIYDNFKRLLAEEDIDFTRAGTGVIINIPVNEVVKSQGEIE